MSESTQEIKITINESELLIVRCERHALTQQTMTNLRDVVVSALTDGNDPHILIIPDWIKIRKIKIGKKKP